jgi:hypothetical protein
MEQQQQQQWIRFILFGIFVGLVVLFYLNNRTTLDKYIHFNRVEEGFLSGGSTRHYKDIGPAVRIVRWDDPAIQKHETQTIPPLLIQTWKTEQIPQKYYDDIASVKAANPDFFYLFFTDDDIERFLQAFYPDYYHTYLRLPVAIQKFDFFRYIAVHHYGGFYYDLDMRATESLDQGEFHLRSEKAIFPIDTWISGTGGGSDHKGDTYPRFRKYADMGFNIGQFAFAAPRNHPFIQVLIEGIHRKIDDIIDREQRIDEKDKSSGFAAREIYIYETTGPDYVTNQYIGFPNKDLVEILKYKPRAQSFGKYAVHNFYGTWK